MSEHVVYVLAALAAASLLVLGPLGLAALVAHAALRTAERVRGSKEPAPAARSRKRRPAKGAPGRTPKAERGRK